MDARFELLQDPDGLWMLWDKDTDMPLEFCGRALVGMSENEARCACDVISRVLINRTAEKRGGAAG